MSRWHVIEGLGPDWDGWVNLCPNADVYHLSAYVAAMNTDPGALPRLVIMESRQGVVAHPLLFRPLGQLNPRLLRSFDATTCYGYGGPIWLLSPGASQEGLLQEFWGGEGGILRELGVVCEFVRLHPLIGSHVPLEGTPGLVERGPTVAVDLAPPPAELEARLSANHRRNIAKARRQGVEVTFDQRPAAVDVFTGLYERTMDRLGARPDYYFPHTSFVGLFALPSGSAWLASAQLGGRTVAAHLYLCGKPFWHYHLGASDEAARLCGANHLLMFESMLLAKELGKVRMQLGGGHSCHEDGLLRFKAGFGGSTYPFRTLQRILNPGAYEDLCAWAEVDASATGYFPAYRTPGAVNQAAR